MSWKIILVGAGVIAREHAAILREVEEFKSVPLHVCDLDAERLADFKEQYPEANTHASLDDLLALAVDELDIVVICTPPKSHAALTMLALKSGRHVLCEKPLAMTIEEAKQMHAVAKEEGKHLACCNSRFMGQANMAKLRASLNDGTLGSAYRLKWVERKACQRTGIEYQPETPWFVKKENNGGGVTMDWAPYDMAMLTELLEPVKVDILHCSMSTPEMSHDLPDDIQIDVEFHVIADMHYHLKDGRKVLVNYERASCSHGEEKTLFELEGTQGAMQFNWVWDETLVHRFECEGELLSEGGEWDRHEVHFHRRPLYFMYRTLRGLDSSSNLNETAVFNFEMIRSLYQSAETGLPLTVIHEVQEVTA